QGEADAVGWPTVFVRLTGCPLRCDYCDTEYAFSGGEWWRIEAVVAEVAHYNVRHVCVTGGEPLAQKGCLALLTQLCDTGLSVSLETSGALDIAYVDPRVSRVMDIKTPISGEAGKNRYENIAHLTPHDQVKLVIGDRNDYEWACAVVEKYDLTARCSVLFSPVFGRIEPRVLADWILEDRLDVRFQLQLHKLLWGDEPGR
ncbi:MAG: 7-carboxy-7-deazaguanine synthase QueE, partial [Gammaproteobacteria bacterium]|nr:7-carboxy-7-deazaguanine synthase QueE [Gammaproteobacteria bacterium]